MATFDKKVGVGTDVVFTVVTPSSVTLKLLKNGSTTISKTGNYTIIDNVLTLKKEYLSTLGVGVSNIELVMSDGLNKFIKITISDTTI
ncbi:MAG: X2-like carbohydrate binding domain-containing protein [Clostridium sp.]